jgi:hypothetical protein
MAKLKGKGTALQQTISAVLTDVAQLTDIDVSGEASGDYDSTTLDGGVYETKDLTGYSSPGTVKAGLFFDPALAGHAAITDLIETPASCVWKLKYSDAGPSSLTYTSAGVGLDQKIVTKDGVKATLTMNRTGSPTRA